MCALLDRVSTPQGDIIILTKTRFYFFFTRPLYQCDALPSFGVFKETRFSSGLQHIRSRHFSGVPCFLCRTRRRQRSRVPNAWRQDGFHGLPSRTGALERLHRWISRLKICPTPLAARVHLSVAIAKLFDKGRIALWLIALLHCSRRGCIRASPKSTQGHNKSTEIHQCSRKPAAIHLAHIGQRISENSNRALRSVCSYFKLIRTRFYASDGVQHVEQWQAVQGYPEVVIWNTA